MDNLIVYLTLNYTNLLSIIAVNALYKSLPPPPPPPPNPSPHPPTPPHPTPPPCLLILLLILMSHAIW